MLRAHGDIYQGDERRHVMAMPKIKKLIDRFGPENPVVKECMKQAIYPEDAQGFELEDIIERLSTIYVLGDDHDDQEM